MKLLIFFPLLSVFVCCTRLVSFSQKTQTLKGYQLKFKIAGIKDTVVYLASYYGPKQYYKDTAKINSQSVAVFEGKDSLPGGIYSIVLPNKATYFEFIVNEQRFYMETDTLDLVKNMKIKGSVENELFYQRLHFLDEKQKNAMPYRKIIDDTLLANDAKKEAREKLIAIDKEVKEYTEKFIADYPNTFVTKVFKTMKEPEVPETPTLPDGSKDSLFPYRYFKEHFFDEVDFTDERLLRTPVFHGKIEKYFEKLTAQIPDSINAAADFMVSKAKPCKENFKYIVHYVTNTYEKSNIMGMDAVFVHMAKKYYMKGEAFWVDTASLNKISERANKLEPLLIGKKIINVILQDTAFKWHALYDVKAKYIVLYIWDSQCGHCKKTTPKLKELYPTIKAKGVEVFSINTEFETDKWTEYVRENQLPWINVSDNPEINKNAHKYLGITNIESLNFRQTFDIYSTPIAYLLDDKFEIIAKRFGIEQLEELLEAVMKRKQQ